MKKIAIYPGTFDPITNGHIDIVQRAGEMFDEIIVTIAVNPAKNPLFTVAERLDLMTESLKSIPNVRVSSFNGLVVECAQENGAIAIIRGLRAISDFEFEFQMALMNHKLAPEVRTVFLMPIEKYTYLNSTLIRQLAQFNADVSDFVPECVQRALKAKFRAS